MKKVLINYNAKDNFGDDLFIRIICDYFSNEQFIVLVPKGRSNNLKGIKNLKIIKITPKNEKKLYLKALEKTDVCFYTGGSAFVENFYNMRDFWDFRELLRQNPLYYINCGFGPYSSEIFLDEAREHLSRCEGVWFRDASACSMFEGENIHYMPPIAFLTDFPEPIKADKPYAVISVIDVSKRIELSMFHDIYINTMKRIANRLKSRGFDIAVLALCDYEGDVYAARELADCGTVIPYDGDTNTILSLIRGAKCVIGSRFHAITCALAAGIPVVPVCYGDDLIHTIKGLDEKIKCFDIKHLDALTDEAFDEAMIYKPAIDVELIKKSVKTELDKILDIIYKK